MKINYNQNDKKSIQDFINKTKEELKEAGKCLEKAEKLNLLNSIKNELTSLSFSIDSIPENEIIERTKDIKLGGLLELLDEVFGFNTNNPTNRLAIEKIKDRNLIDIALFIEEYNKK